MKINSEPFFGTGGLNVIIVNYDTVTEVVSIIIDELMQVLLTSLISTSQNAH